MSDIFGIGNALRGMVRVYEISSRCTGRTSAMVKVLQDGDKVVFTSSAEARRVENLCKQAGKTIKPIVCEPRNRPQIIQYAGGGNVVFDHVWVEQFYKEALDSAYKDLYNLQRHMCQDFPEMRDTPEKDLQIRKWTRYD